MSGMKKYLVFSGERYYPLGGIDDFDNSFSNMDEAIDYCVKSYLEDYGRWFQIVDYNTLKVLKSADIDYNSDSKMNYVDWDEK